MITPTIGRVVWYHPGNKPSGLAEYPDQPMIAFVCYVWHDRLVNLLVIDHAGLMHARPNVNLIQDGDPSVTGVYHYCEWMPYQKGQAAKTEALEKEKAA